MIDSIAEFFIGVAINVAGNLIFAGLCIVIRIIWSRMR